MDVGRSAAPDFASQAFGYRRALEADGVVIGRFSFVRAGAVGLVRFGSGRLNEASCEREGARILHAGESV